MGIRFRPSEQQIHKMKAYIALFCLMAVALAKPEAKPESDADPQVYYNGLYTPYAGYGYGLGYSHTYLPTAYHFGYGKREAEPEPYRGYGYGGYGGYGGYRGGYYGGYRGYRGKREAEAEADPALIYSSGYHHYPYTGLAHYNNFGYSGLYNTPYAHSYVHTYGKREAEAEAEPWRSYYGGYSRPYAYGGYAGYGGYGGYRGYGYYG